MYAVSSYTRQRVESWREDVAYYLKTGTLCSHVTGSLDDRNTEIYSFTNNIKATNQRMSHSYIIPRGTNPQREGKEFLRTLHIPLDNYSRSIAKHANCDHRKPQGWYDLVSLGLHKRAYSSFPSVRLPQSSLFEQRKQINRCDVPDMLAYWTNETPATAQRIIKATTCENIPTFVAKKGPSLEKLHHRHWFASQAKHYHYNRHQMVMGRQCNFMYILSSSKGATTPMHVSARNKSTPLLSSMKLSDTSLKSSFHRKKSLTNKM